MTIEDTLNKIASHLDNFNKQEDKNKLLTTCKKLLSQLSEDKSITPELLERITQLQETINTLENNLNRTDNGLNTIEAASEEVDYDWVTVDSKGNEIPSTYPSTAPSSMPSFAPSSIPSSTSSVSEQILGTSNIGFAGATFGSGFNNLFPGKHFQNDPDGDGGIY